MLLITIRWTVLLLALLLTAWQLSQYQRWHQPHHYGLVIDAGSTGSRIHLYIWAADGKRLLKDELRTVTPGLNWFFDRGRLVEEELGPQLASLIDQVLPLIDRPLSQPIPLILLATAGLRLVPEQLTAVRMRQIVDYISDRYPQLRFERAEILSGHGEALYAWLTTQQLLEMEHSRLAVVDLGGASVQFAHHWPSTNLGDYGGQAETTEPSVCHSHRTDCCLDSNPVCLQTTLAGAGEKLLLLLHTRSYLGYGLLAMRERHWQMIDSAGPGHPCASFLSDVNDNVNDNNVNDNDNDNNVKDNVNVNNVNNVNVNNVNNDNNDNNVNDSTVDLCLKSIEQGLLFGNVDSPLNNVISPLPADYEIVAFSFVFDRTRDLIGETTAYLAIAHPDNDDDDGNCGAYDDADPHELWTLADLRWLSEAVCTGKLPSTRRLTSGTSYFARLFRHSSDPADWPANLMKRLAERRQRYPHACWDLLYIYSLLKHGLRLSDRRLIRIMKRVNDMELGWTLGAIGEALFKRSH